MAVRAKCLWAVLASASLAGCGDDWARIEATNLTLDPCHGGEARTFAPFVLAADLVTWYSGGGGGQVAMRRGWKAWTKSDGAVLQFPDLSQVRALIEAGEAVPLDDKKARLSLVLRATCPDSTVALVGRDGSIKFSSFDTSTGGTIAGSGHFDLYDERGYEEGAAPLAPGATISFSFEVRRGVAFEGFTH